jgi:hypothetical protein
MFGNTPWTKALPKMFVGALTLNNPLLLEDYLTHKE